MCRVGGAAPTELGWYRSRKQLGLAQCLIVLRDKAVVGVVLGGSRREIGREGAG